MHGSTLSGLAVANGYEASSFGKALRRPWPTVERIIAQFLGENPQHIWPSRYHRSGVPIRAKARRGAAARLRQNDKAA
ncbi:transcriptional regulator [Ancylobacter aquaticus]|nr:transcriptional regulator [Ancylobacter aquaticus]